MLSFELSVVDFVLLIAIAVVLALFLSQMQNKSAKSESIRLNQKKPFENQGAAVKTISGETPSTRPATSFQKCAHHFGYLRNLPDGSILPDECAGCPKTMRCVFPNR